MKLNINTETKELEISEEVNLNELFSVISLMFPNDSWKEYTLKVVPNIITIGTPIIVKPYTIPTYPYYPWWTTGGTTGDVTQYNYNSKSSYSLEVDFSKPEDIIS